MRGRDDEILRRPRRKKPPTTDPEAAPHLDDEPDGVDRLVIVDYVPPRCPKCGRSRRVTYGRRGRTRYHKCQDCRDRNGDAYRFLSRESDDEISA